MDAGSFADWVAAAAALTTAGIAAYAGYLGIRTFQHQRTSFDIQLALGIFDTINRYWDRLTDTKSANYDYDMGQILAQFEVAASLFNHDILTKSALPILKDHIVEIFSSIAVSTDGPRLLQACCSSPETFKELRTFLKKHTPTALNAMAFRDDMARL